LRADRLSCYGHERTTSPNLDRLAAEGYLFLDSSSSSTWTLPSTATMLTGLLPDQHRVQRIPEVLHDDVETVAERLREAGYRTAALTDGGFLNLRWGFTQGFQRYDTTGGEAWDPTKDVAVIESMASEWLRENRFEPFFLFVHTYETHQPYTNAEGFADGFLDPDYGGELTETVNPWSLGGKARDSAEVRRAKALYDGEIARADHYIGRLLDLLRRQDRYDNTAILVTSDHGEEFLEHGGIEHATGKVFDENVRVPMIFKPPGGGDGATVAMPTSSIDLVPTLLELAGLETPTTLTGRSLVGLVHTQRSEPRAVLVHGLSSLPERIEERYRLDLGSQSIVFDRVGERVEAYDRANDPGMQAPVPVDVVGSDHPLVPRLQLMLAWATAEGRFFSRLPRESDRLAIPDGSQIESLGVWDGLSWRPMSEDRELRLRSGAPHTLVFDTDSSRGAPILLLGPAGPDAAPVQLVNERSVFGWNPFNGASPQPLTMIPTAETYRAVSLELESADLEELRSLGYVQ
jgi:arylsulfatase A-like enzyme